MLDFLYYCRSRHIAVQWMDSLHVLFSNDNCGFRDCVLRVVSISPLIYQTKESTRGNFSPVHRQQQGKGFSDSILMLLDLVSLLNREALICVNLQAVGLLSIRAPLVD